MATLIATLALSAGPCLADSTTLPPDAKRAMDMIYQGDPDAAIPIARGLEQAEPENPAGFFVEAEADWWKMYCAACEIKWGMVDAWKRGKKPADDAYLALTDEVIHHAQAQLAKSETAEMHVYAGVGWGLKTRLYALRGESRNVARAGVNARAEMLRALQLDPQMADATTGVGLYNYYVDSLSPIVKMLRFFMGIPGGNKEEGIRQIRTGIEQGSILAVDARFYLAKSLRTYDRQYEQALSLAEPLTARYPRNPLFLLLAGNLNAEMGRNAKAAEYFHAALDSPPSDSACGARIRDAANSLLAALHSQ